MRVMLTSCSPETELIRKHFLRIPGKNQPISQSYGKSRTGEEGILRMNNIGFLPDETSLDR